jgi:hypothetical protein
MRLWGYLDSQPTAEHATDRMVCAHIQITNRDIQQLRCSSSRSSATSDTILPSASRHCCGQRPCDTRSATVNFISISIDN